MSPRAVCCLALCLTFVPAVGFATVRDVPGTYPTIQAAIDASSLGDVVEVAPGTYHERLTIGPAQDGITVRGLAGAGATIVDALGTGTTLTVTHVGALTRIEGLAIRGGAIQGAGGGVYLYFASPVLTDCVIEGNHAYAAGGIYVDRASAPRFTRCVVRNNQAPNGSGGGVYVDHGGQPSLAYCQVYGNTCAAFGGGVTVWEGSLPALDHCTIAGNGGDMAGGNLYLTRLGRVYATHSVFAFSTVGANVEAAPDAATSAFDCCDLFVDSGANVAGMPSPVGANGNVALDPQFCDRAAGNYGLAASSPCSPNTACGQIGALDVQCAPVPVAGVTWGSLKSRYR
jgi:hypothetical protein